MRGPRSWSRGRRVAVGAALCLLLAPAPGHAQEEGGSGLSSYKLLANAPGLALEGLYRDVALTVPEVTSSLTTGAVGSGLASLAWPGPVIGNGGSTILVLAPQAPPQTTMLNDPIRAQSRTSGPQKASNTDVPGAVMTSSATPEEVTAQASTGEATTLPVGETGVLSAQSKVAFTDATTAVAEASSLVEHLSLAGGAIDIGSVRSTASATTDGRKASAKGSTAVSGMTVGGVPVSVDDKGLHVAGQDQPSPVPQEALNSAIAALGLEAHLTEPRTTVTGGSVHHSSGALVLIWKQGTSQYALTVGRASVDLDAAPGLPDLGGTGPLPAPPAPAAGGPAPAVPAQGPAAAVAAPGVAAPPATSQAPAVAAPQSAPLVPVALALARGIPAPVTALGLILAGLLAAGLRRLPDRVLAVPAVDCDERLS